LELLRTGSVVTGLETSSRRLRAGDVTTVKVTGDKEA